MADPFAGMDGEEQEHAKELSESVNKRLTKSMTELQERHANGTNERDDPDRAPTGSAYHAAAQAKKMNQQKQHQEQMRLAETQKMIHMKSQAHNVFGNKNVQEAEDENDASSKASDSDSEYDDLLNETDDALDAIRHKRMEQLRQQQGQAAEHRALGHGELRTIAQDDFLPECTGKSEWVAMHFYHKEFERCKIMDHHLKIIAGQHMNCKFLRMDAEKAPFFVHKLQVKTLPTLIVFREGKAIDKLYGFEGLAKNANEPDQWHTGRLQQWLAGTGAIQYKVPTEELREEMESMGIRPKGTVWSGTSRSGFRSTNYDSDDE